MEKQGMPKVLIVSPTDPRRRLRETSLWRADVRRFVVTREDTAFEQARALVPDLVVIDCSDPVSAASLIEHLRRDEVTRTTSIAVLGPASGSADEEALRRAGANLVLGDGADPLLWEARLEELLSVPHRRVTRLPVRVEVWCRSSPEAPALGAFALNVGVRGLLLETETPLSVGSKLDLTFALPDQGEDLHVVGQVIRQATPANELPCYGIEFLLPRREARERIEAFVESRVR